MNLDPPQMFDSVPQAPDSGQPAPVPGYKKGGMVKGYKHGPMTKTVNHAGRGSAKSKKRG